VISSVPVRLARIRAICFDLDNTFWDVYPVIARAEAQLQAWLEEHYPAIPARYSLDEMRAHRQALMLTYPDRAHDFNYIRTESLAQQAESVGYSRALAEPGFEVFYRARNQVELFGDVEPAVRKLRLRYTLATLSNGNADLERIGIDSWFVLTASARGIGSAKPDARAFRHVSDALRLDPAEVLYVGDDPHLDVAGARNAGMCAAWINRVGTAWPDELAPPDIAVADLGALERALTLG
jgi:putative hydrolase of the HAD superfamily